MLSCKKIWEDFLVQYDNNYDKVDILKELKRDILIQKVVVKPMLQNNTLKKLAEKRFH